MPTLDWIGKDQILGYHKKVPYCVLDRKYSYDVQGSHMGDNGSKNMIIHGDNLYALKSLLPKYEGRIKCIYIDPPYNTGNEGWVYNDNMNDPFFVKWLGDVVGKEGEDLSRHDKWLCMMYPRLVLLHKLLREDGAIFISIDDNEISNLRLIMDEIFGSSHFIAQISLLCNPKGRSQDKYFATNHEYLLVYSKGFLPAGSFSVEKPQEQLMKQYKLSDDLGSYRLLTLRNTHREFGRHNRPNLWYPFYVNPKDCSVQIQPDDTHNVEVYPIWDDGFEGCWTWDKNHSSESLSMISSKKTSSGKWNIFRKNYGVSEGEVVRTKLFTIWSDPRFYTEKGQLAFGQIFPGTSKEDFPQPKSVYYIEEIVRCFTGDGDIILDSFAGSGTTAHAVLNVNKDGLNRNFILVEKMDYADTVTSERIKRVIKGYSDLPGAGGSFSFFELGEPLLEDGFINDKVSIQQLRQYIWFTETKDSSAISDEGYYLGSLNGISYYFCYDSNKSVSFDDSMLPILKSGSEGHVVYADVCYLSDQLLKDRNIIFKKIPRDIRRF